MKWYTSTSTRTWLTLDHRPGVSDLLDISLPNTVVHQPFGIIVGSNAHIIFQSFASIGVWQKRVTGDLVRGQRGWHASTVTRQKLARNCTTNWYAVLTLRSHGLQFKRSLCKTQFQLERPPQLLTAPTDSCSSIPPHFPLSVCFRHIFHCGSHLSEGTGKYNKPVYISRGSHFTKE